MRRRRAHPTSLSKLLKKVYPSSSPDDYDAARLFGWWARSMPPRIVNRARPVRFRHGILFVNVSSSAWAQELHHSAEDILQRVREFAPSIRIKSIRFQPGPLPEIPTGHQKKTRRTKLRKVQIAALPEELGRALARVGDDDLRATIARAATTSLANEED